ncbi:MAG: T9SS type A sorting domain-containing protein [Flavobacteriales bacterium]|nr:T9SS type A sorting domain-containing protein [Flavobacteriales bacterium]
MKHYTVGVLALLAAVQSTAQTTAVAWTAPLDCNAAGDGALRPRITINGDGNPVVLWATIHPTAITLSWATVPLSLARWRVSAPGCVPAVADWMGSSIASFGNTVWVVMKGTPEESKPVYVRRSDDGGYTWGDTMRVEPYDGLVSRFPSIALDDPDAPLVQYMQFDSGYFGARQVVSHMMGGGFMSPVQVSTPFAPGDVCDCCPNQVVVQGSNVVALYRNAGPNIRVMWGASSDDGGVTFPFGAEIDTTGWALNSCPSSGPDGYLDGDSLRYVWMSGANNGTKVYLGNALAADLSLGAQWNVQPGQMQMLQQNFPRIAGSGDTLGIVWQQSMAGQHEILFSWSVTGPSGLSTPDTVNLDPTGAQKTPDIAYADGAFHIVWSELATGQVRYRKATLTNDVGVQAFAPEVMRVFPDPASDYLFVEGSTASWAEVVDLQGRVHLSVALGASQLDVRALAPASYVLRITDASGQQRTARFTKR